MQNGNGNDTAAPQAPAPQRQINPQQAAAFGLEFLERASHTRAERERFDIAQALLNAIVQGQVVLTSPQQPAMPIAEAPAASPPS